MSTFQLNFVEEADLKNLLLLNLEVYFIVNVYDFSFDCNPIDKSDILNFTNIEWFRIT